MPKPLVRTYKQLCPLFTGAPSIKFAEDVEAICSAFPELRSMCLDKILDAVKRQFVLANSNSSGGGRMSAENTNTIINGCKYCSGSTSRVIPCYRFSLRL